MIEDFYSQFMSSEDLVFDIGANVGNRTRVFSGLARKVIAVEPQIGLVANEARSLPNVVVVEKACGASEGRAEMLIASSSTISSLSPAWVEAVKKTGRFKENTWNEKRMVEITTLDALIQEHGVPAFIKIDVEGYEDEALCGLTHRVKALSFEFTPEHEASRVRSLAMICALGDYEFNYDWGECFRLYLGAWTDIGRLTDELDRFRNDPLKANGDVYARLK